MIIIGYPGIGKSTLARKDNNYIDLESSNFNINGSKYDDWYIPYCNIAEDLSSQSHFVFVSSHDPVRKQLKSSKEDVIMVYPSLDLEWLWIQRLTERYTTTKSNKDLRALQRTEKYFESDITDLDADKDFPHIVLSDYNYDLGESLENYLVSEHKLLGWRNNYEHNR